MNWEGEEKIFARDSGFISGCSGGMEFPPASWLRLDLKREAPIGFPENNI